MERIALTPRPTPPSRILPPGLTTEEYENRFLAEFGVAPGERGLYEDATGEFLVISNALFRSRRGTSKFRNGRERYVLLYADTIKDPDEIRLAWTLLPTGRMAKRRRYIARWNADGVDVPVLVVYEAGRGHEGWVGVTAFASDTIAYLEKRREEGYLLHAKK